MLVEFIPLVWKHSIFRPVSVCTGPVGVVQFCRPYRALVNLLLLVMSDTVGTQVSWGQNAPTLLLEELSCLPTAPYHSHDTPNPPPPSQGLCSHLLNNAIKKVGEGSEKPGCFLHLICCLWSEVSRRDETAAGYSHGLCLAYWSWYCSATCRQSLIFKTYKQNSPVNWIFKLWVMLSFFMKEGFKNKLIDYIWT